MTAKQQDFVKLLLERDEEFAKFVFTHFGGYWSIASNLRALHPHERQVMKDLPTRIHDRVTEMAREYEMKRGGP